MVYIRLDIVNKYQYQESDNYREIKILVPKSSEELEKDFDYLGLDYNNLTIQDTHIKECEFIFTDDPAFASSLSDTINRLIEKAGMSGYTTPFEDMKKFYSAVASLDVKDRDKLLAVLELEKENILNLRHATKYAKQLSCYEFYKNIHTPEEYAEELIRRENVSMSDIKDYIDLYQMGDDYYKSEGGEFVEQGLIIQTESIRNVQIEEEEEFE